MKQQNFIKLRLNSLCNYVKKNSLFNKKILMKNKKCWNLKEKLWNTKLK